MLILSWRREPESNRRTRLCRPLHNHSVIAPFGPLRSAAGETGLPDFPRETGAAEESRTLDLNLGKVALYQLSYCRERQEIIAFSGPCDNCPATCTPQTRTGKAQRPPFDRPARLRLRS